MPDPVPADFTAAPDLHALLEAHRPAWWGAGYPPEVRAEVAAWAGPLHDRGHGWNDLAAALGVSRNSLRTWCSHHRTKAESPTGDHTPWLPVRVTSPAKATPQPERPVLVTPTGFRVENLDEDLLLRILRELA
jgi:transposase-like protein